ncbi:hypothetical protein DFH06DRAFT_1336995 [Mycena polygramma]|nr:hypothetical protein DFH06DRAFT_1336995 [Mycena polygramma]
MAASKQHAIDKGGDVAASGTYQTALKTLWDELDSETKLEWDAKAEEECGDVAKNQEEFHTNIHQALRSLCQSGIVGDAEMLLFYAFREPECGDLKAGTIHGHSTHNKINFGGEELEQTYGVPWAKFADGAIPCPVVENSDSISIVITDGIAQFPAVDLNTIPPLSLRHLIQEYFEQCWLCRNSGTLPIPWPQVTGAPSEFYDTEKFVFPLALKDPQTFTIFETLVIGEFLISNTATPFLFKNDVPQIPIVNPAPPLPQTNVGFLGPQATDGIPSPPKPPTDSGSRSRSTTPSPSTKSRSTTPAPSITPSRSGSPPPKQDVPLPEPELSTPPPPPRPKRGGKAGTKRAREASNPDDPDQEDGRRKKRKAPIRIREGQDNDVANTRRRSTRQSAGAIGTDVRNAQKKIATKPGKPRYKGWVEVLSENSSDEN